MNTFLSLSLSLARAPYYRSVVRVSRKPDLETRILRPGSAPWVLIPHCDLEEVTSFLRLSFSLFFKWRERVVPHLPAWTLE